MEKSNIKTEQVKFLLYYKLYNEDEVKKLKNKKEIKLPVTWNKYLNSGGGGIDYSFEEYIYEGPKDEKDKVVKIINKYYENLEHKINFFK
jgi:hypothetical protein